MLANRILDLAVLQSIIWVRLHSSFPTIEFSYGSALSPIFQLVLGKLKSPPKNITSKEMLEIKFNRTSKSNSVWAIYRGIINAA